MKLEEIKQNLKVRTKDKFNKNATRGMLISERNLNNRKEDAIGRILDYVPGHGGDVWWVVHEDNTVAPYCFNEFNPTKDQPFLKKEQPKI